MYHHCPGSADAIYQNKQKAEAEDAKINRNARKDVPMRLKT
jgi:hypothetical protein